jgi:hypothetical protein
MIKNIMVVVAMVLSVLIIFKRLKNCDYEIKKEY